MAQTMSRLADRINSLNFSDTSEDERFTKQVQKVKKNKRNYKEEDVEKEQEGEEVLMQVEQEQFQQSFGAIEARILRLEQDLSRSLISSRGTAYQRNKAEASDVSDISTMSYSLFDEKEQYSQRDSKKIHLDGSEKFKNGQIILDMKDNQGRKQSFEEQSQYEDQNDKKKINNQRGLDENVDRQRKNRRDRSSNTIGKVQSSNNSNEIDIQEDYQITNFGNKHQNQKRKYRQEEQNQGEQQYHNDGDQDVKSQGQVKETGYQKSNDDHRYINNNQQSKYRYQKTCSLGQNHSANSRSFEGFEKETEELHQRVDRIRKELENEENEDENENEEVAQDQMKNQQDSDEEEIIRWGQQQKNLQYQEKSSILKNSNNISSECRCICASKSNCQHHHHHHYQEHQHHFSDGNCSCYSNIPKIPSSQSNHNNNHHQESHNSSSNSCYLDKAVHDSQLRLLQQLEQNKDYDINEDYQYSMKQQQQQQNFNNKGSQQKWTDNNSNTDSVTNRSKRESSRDQYLDNESHQFMQQNAPSRIDHEQSQSMLSNKSEIVSLLEREKQLLEEIKSLRQNNESLTGCRNVVRNPGESLLDSTLYNSEVHDKRVYENSINGNNENKKQKRNNEAIASGSNSNHQSSRSVKRRLTDIEQLKKETEILKQVEKMRKNIQHSIKQKINEDKIVEREAKQQIARSQKHSSLLQQQPAATVKKNIHKAHGVKNCENCSFLLNRGIPTTFCSCDQQRRY